MKTRILAACVTAACLLCLVPACETKPASELTLLNDAVHRPQVAIKTRISLRPHAAGRDRAALDAFRARFPARRSFRLIAGDRGFQFVQPAAIVEAADGSSLYVLDRRAMEVLRVEPDGKAWPLLGPEVPITYRPRVPHSLVELGDTQWVIADRTTQLKVFSMQQGRLVAKALLPIDARSDHMCRFGSVFVVRGFSAGGDTVHEYDRQGTLIRSFDRGYEHRSELVRRQLSPGLVACDSGSKTVITLSEAFPLVHGYSIEGTRLWTTELEGMKLEELALVKTDLGAEAVQRRRGVEFDRMGALLPLGKGQVLFQFVRMRARNNEVDREVHSVILSTADGSGEYLGTAILLAIGVAGPRLFVVDINDLRTVSVLDAGGV